MESSPNGNPFAKAQPDNSTNESSESNYIIYNK